jgi:hypothetical protein
MTTEHIIALGICLFALQLLVQFNLIIIARNLRKLREKIESNYGNTHKGDKP